jgi:hypothetical protein
MVLKDASSNGGAEGIVTAGPPAPPLAPPLEVEAVRGTTASSGSLMLSSVTRENTFMICMKMQGAHIKNIDNDLYSNPSQPR